ncbi:hypothetical protein F511_33317 [Dorcoceras hygrometricum]|uniref:Uncharacterized protein n=1 Tax=Dorcoceras hygrometricum TaxID=472368 RepID=A0A2Z7A8R2_9LAMI|nr:hypothetical protein F511_33317 [Dorcoceras hygrometricum]
MQGGRIDEFPPLLTPPHMAAPPPSPGPPPKPPDDHGSNGPRSYAAAFLHSSPRTKRNSFMEYADGENIQAKEIVMYNNTPSIQFSSEEAAALEPSMLPDCQKNKNISSLESFQASVDSLDPENVHRDLNMGAADDALRNTNKVGGGDQILAAAVASRDRALVQMGCDMSSGYAKKIIEENLETDTGAENSEDDELQDTFKGPLQRSLSAGNLMLKGPALPHRVVTRSHTRSQGSRTPQNPPQVLNTLSSVSVRESRIHYLCDPQWFMDTASRGPITIAAPESQFRTCPSDHGKSI